MTKRLKFIIILAFLLRIAFVGSFPALYADEAAFGYNAYLLSETGRDEFGRFWPMGFESFGDWKPPMSAWLAIPFIKIFGLNEFAVRLPSVILGTMTVAIMYFLSKELFRERRAKSEERSDKKPAHHQSLITNHQSLPLLAAFLLSISPWHILMSRMAMLVGIEVFFVSLGILVLLKGLKESRWWVLSAVSFPAAIYSYYGSRVTVPLILVAFIFTFRHRLFQRWRTLILPTIIGGLCLVPLLVSAARNPLVLTGRVRTTSVFFNDNIRLQLWDARTKAGLRHIPPVVTRFFDNKLYYYSTDIISRYVQHFSPSFLFFRGDHQAPFRTSGFGVVHLLDLPFFLIGLLAIRKSMTKKHSVEQVILERSLARGGRSDRISRSYRPALSNASIESAGLQDDKHALFLCLYLMLAPFVSSLTFLTPAANRSFNLVIPWTIVTAIGVFASICHFTNSRRSMSGVTTVIYVVSFALFFWRYAIVSPRDNPRNWQIGKKELVQKVKPLLSSVDTVISTDHGGPAYIFFAFYLPITPDELFRTIVRNQEFDELGFEHVDRILNITIPRDFTWKKALIDQNAVYIGFENELPHDKIDLASRVYYPNGGVAYEIGTLKYWVTEH